MDCYDWKSIDTGRAQRAVDKGARVFPLPTPFYQGGASYTHGLETKRGTCYRVSKLVMAGINLPTDQ